MSLKRIGAVCLQEIFITLRSMEMIFDVFIFSVISLLLFGFLSLYLAGTQNSKVAQFLLLGILLWEIVRITQYSLSIGSLWNIWSRNLSNMFVSPVRLSEYILAHTLSGIAKTLITFTLNATITIIVFHFNIFQLGWINLLLFFINLILFSFSVGISVLALIFKYGTRIQAFAWGVIPILQPVTAAFFPVTILPHPLREIAYLFPITYIFEAARYGLTYYAVNWQLIGLALVINLIYLFLSTNLFRIMFDQSRESGQFARNEG